MTYTDRVAVIAGATGMLGRVVTAEFARAGARLGLVGTDPERLRSLATDLGLADDAWLPAVGDLRREDEARRAIAQVTQRFGHTDILLHLVGGWAGGTPILRLDPEELRSMLDQHLWTTLHAVRAVLPGMVERGWGRIVAVTTPYASEIGPNRASYAIAKAAEEVLLRTLGREVGGSGVTANLVSVRKIDAAHERERTPTTKNAAWTTPEEIAATMLSLCSDAGGAINGARIPLDGRG